jgi:MFS family permease
MNMPLPTPLGSPWALSSLRMQVALLALMQGLLLVNNVTLIAINGLVGFQLADNKLLATLPVTGYVLGGAVWSMPAAAIMRRFGRRVGYSLASVVAFGGAFVAWYAVSEKNLYLLCLATFICGFYSAFGASIRFAAADVADAYQPSFKAKAISLVLAGGILGGIVGPEVSKWSRTWLSTQFAGTYLTLAGFAVLSFLLAQLVRLPVTKVMASDVPPRPLKVILAQPTCWIAILCAALAYGTMNLLMVATPLAMDLCKHPYALAALVLEWHVIGMFAPGLITGNLIQRFGTLPIIVTGCALMLLSVAIALSGVELMNFIAGLALLGVGWNFMFTGGTNLLTTCYKPSEKNKVQGFTDFCVFTVMITSSASSGALLHTNGWALLNALAAPFMVIVFGASVWLATKIGWQVGKTNSALAVQK